MIRRVAVLFAVLLFSGCGTLVTLPDMQPYGGMQKNVHTAGSRLSNTGDKLVSVADLPLSFCLDTVLLPVTLPVWLATPSDPEPLVLEDSSNLDITFATVAAADLPYNRRP